jgi:AraC family transcriptional regulator
MRCDRSVSEHKLVRVAYRHFQPVTVFYARGLGPYGESAQHAWQAMGAWLDQHRARRRVKQAFGLFRDNPKTTAPELLRYDACIPVMFDSDFALAPGIGRQALPGGAYAVHTHVGSYDEVGGLLSHLHNRIVPERALSVDYDRPFMAIHLNDPAITREVHRRTELCVPVVPIAMPLPSNDAGREAPDTAALARRLASAG